MYIVKNALRCIARSKGRNILIGIIALVIAISACLGLSIRQASETAKASALNSISVTATISYDRSSMMGQMGGGKMPSGAPSDMPSGFGGGFDFSNFGDLSEMFGGAADYITQIDSAMNLTVVFQMLGVGLLLTVIASAASVLFIMRYDPLKILANRD